MQAAIIAFPTEEDMPVTEKRFNRLAKSIETMADRLTKLETNSPPPATPRTHWTAYLPLATVATALLGICVTIFIHFDNKIDASQSTIQALSKNVDKLEAAVKVIGDQQSQQTQGLIHDLLATATTTTSLPTAAKALQVASQLTETLRKEKRPSPPEFFQSAVNLVGRANQPQLGAAALGIRKQLAEYRSALQPPQQFGSTETCTPGFKGSSLFISQNVANVVSDMTVANCPVVLDGITWKNVAFVNSRIVYNGGPVNLENVVFVNCAFDVKGNGRSEDVLEYAALSKKELIPARKDSTAPN